MSDWEEIGTTPKGRKILRKGDEYRVQSGHQFRNFPTNQPNYIYGILKSSGKSMSTYDITVKTKLQFGDVQEKLYVLMAEGKIKRKLKEEKGPGGREYLYFIPESKPDRSIWTFVVKMKNGTRVNVHNLNMQAKGVVYLFNQDCFQRVDIRQIESIEIQKSEPTN